MARHAVVIYSRLLQDRFKSARMTLAAVVLVAFVEAIQAGESPPAAIPSNDSPHQATVVDAYLYGTKEKIRQAGIGDTLAVQIENLDLLMAESAKRQKPLLLFLDGRPLKSLVAFQIGPVSEGTLLFTLARTEDSRSTWTFLLGRPTSHLRPTKVSVGFEGDAPVASKVADGAFNLLVFSPCWVLFWLLLFLILLAGGVILAIKTDLLRDNGPQPPNGGRRPFSLGRTQMAWWFFLTLAAYLLIGILTGDYATSITSSVLVLIGISAGTALGAATIDASKKTDLHVQQTASAAASLQQDLKSATNVAGTSAESVKVETIKDRLKIVQNHSRGFLWDLLSDADGINFHRFQLLVWTIVLGIVFAYTTWRDLAMPSFSETLLTLMGISSGTYLGFKIPENTIPASTSLPAE